MKRTVQILSVQILSAALALASTVAIGQAKHAQGQQAPSKQYRKYIQADQQGQKVFDQNCSRCHNAPEGFSPSISGTIAKHMRVRANLSEADYKALLRFLNP